MAETITAKISVVQKPHSRLVIFLSQVGFWILLVGSIAVSRIWLGGSFIVELLALVLSIAMLVMIGRRSMGVEVTMTPAELRRWLAAGAPKNVVEWRKNSLQQDL